MKERMKGKERKGKEVNMRQRAGDKKMGGGEDFHNKARMV